MVFGSTGRAPFTAALRSQTELVVGKRGLNGTGGSRRPRVARVDSPGRALRAREPLRKNQHAVANPLKPSCMTWTLVCRAKHRSRFNAAQAIASMEENGPRNLFRADGR